MLANRSFAVLEDATLIDALESVSFAVVVDLSKTALREGIGIGCTAWTAVELPGIFLST